MKYEFSNTKKYWNNDQRLVIEWCNYLVQQTWHTMLEVNKTLWIIPLSFYVWDSFLVDLSSSINDQITSNKILFPNICSSAVSGLFLHGILRRMFTVFLLEISKVHSVYLCMCN